jgi:LPS sulfotransferase NodH
MKCVSVVSAQRSGSTLLDMLLGSIDGFFSGGELRYLWERGLIERRRCGCSLEVSHCPVWSKVLASPRLSHLDPNDVVLWQHRVARNRHTRRLLKDSRARARDPQLARLIETMTALHETIGRVTGARVVVDSSKRPADAALAMLIPGVQTYVVHLVRDPRGVAYSRSRRKVEFDHECRPEMARQSFASSGASWLWLNSVASLLSRHEVPVLRVRYEDLVAEPAAWLSRILDFVDEPHAALPLRSRIAMLRPNHTVSGNPNRFSTGETKIDADNEWRDAIGPANWCAATCASLPLIRRYGYAIRTGAPTRR